MPNFYNSSETNFFPLLPLPNFFFFPLLSLIFWNFGAPFTWGLSQLPNSPKEGPITLSTLKAQVLARPKAKLSLTNCKKGPIRAPYIYIFITIRPLYCMLWTMFLSFSFFVEMNEPLLLQQWMIGHLLSSMSHTWTNFLILILLYRTFFSHTRVIKWQSPEAIYYCLCS